MWHRKNTSSLNFFFKSSGDGCNKVICYCNIDTYANKNGKISCTKTEEVCVYPSSLSGKNCTEGQKWFGDNSEWLCKKKLSSLTFFFKLIGDGCNGYGGCECLDVDNVTKIGKIGNCASSEAGCHPDEADNGTAGEFPLLQILFCVSFFLVMERQEKCEEGKEWKEENGEWFC